MAGVLSGEPSHYGASEGNLKISCEKTEVGGHWYFSRKEIEEHSPSRQDGIDLKKENYLRKSYCTFLQDLGMRLKVPQVTIATAIIFCHRFFLSQSHVKNDRRIIATVCMFLAGKVEETPRPLKDVILVSYEIINKKDDAAMQRIKQKEVYEEQKELILQGERAVLATLGFDLNLQHPYKPLVEAIKKFQVAQNALAQVAWNFVNDGLRTSLCLQFKPHHIAAGAIFLAAKFLKVKLPSDGEKVWWQEFDVTPRQLEEVSNQMLELYEQNRMLPNQSNEAEESAGILQQRPSKDPANEENVDNYSSHGVTSKAVSLKLPLSKAIPDHKHVDTNNACAINDQTRNNEYGRSKVNIPDCKRDNENGEVQNREMDATHPRSSEEIQDKARSGIDECREHDQDGNSLRIETKDNAELKDKHYDRKDATVGRPPQDAIKKINREKVKAALERRKARGNATQKTVYMDELERELEDVEVPSGIEKVKHEKQKHSRSKESDRDNLENSHHMKCPDEAGDGHCPVKNGQCLGAHDFDSVEEGELESIDYPDRGFLSPGLNTHKRKANFPLEKALNGTQRTDHVSGSHKQYHHDYQDDRNGKGKLGYSERGYKKHMQENHA